MGVGLGDEKTTAEEGGGQKRPPPIPPPAGGKNPAGEVLHQRSRLPQRGTTVAVAGFLISAAVAYFVLYSMKKPEASAKDVAKVATGVGHPQETRPNSSQV